MWDRIRGRRAVADVWVGRKNRYPLICSGAGLVAGMFGIGGGIVKGPLMLEMGVTLCKCGKYKLYHG